MMVQAAVKFVYDDPSEEMLRFFFDRTDKHVKRVAVNLERLAESFPELDRDECMERGESHDETKYQAPLLVPYIWLSWWYENDKDDLIYPEGMKERVCAACERHVTTETHHPEALGESSMELEDLAEMVADWHAMTQELGGSTFAWADKNIGSKWKFDDEQVGWIYSFIEVLENGNGGYG